MNGCKHLEIQHNGGEWHCVECGLEFGALCPTKAEMLEWLADNWGQTGIKKSRVTPGYFVIDSIGGTEARCGVEVCDKHTFKGAITAMMRPRELVGRDEHTNPTDSEMLDWFATGAMVCGETVARDVRESYKKLKDMRLAIKDGMQRSGYEIERP